MGALVAASRLPFCVSVAQDPDGARFARALLRYDLAQGHPHPPGYPLFIALGAAVHLVVASPARALAVVSALSLGALVAAFTRWCIPRFGLAASVVGAALLALVPLTTFLSARPLSDLLGAALAWWALLSALRPNPDARRTAALSALVVLVRASTFALCAPAFAVALLRDRSRLVAALALFAATATLGYAPVLLLTGPTRFFHLVINHGAGHFQRFGGSVVTQPDLLARARALAWTAWTHCLGGGWSDRPSHLYAAGFVVLAVSLVGLRSLRPYDRELRVIAGCAAVYGLWAFLGQNILWSPRHLLPLVPVVAGCFAAGTSALLRRSPFAALPLSLALLSLGHESLRLSRLQRDQAPPAVALAEWFASHTNPRTTVIATAQLGPWIRGLTPAARVVDVEDARDLPRLHLAATDALFVTSEVHGAVALGGAARARFVRDRYVNPALYDLAIIELRR